VKAAEFLLEHMSRTLWDPVDPTKLGSLDPKLRAKVNGEIYRFSGKKTLARFKKDPAMWCGILRDPVNGVRFIPSLEAQSVQFQDSPYFFWSDSTQRIFSAAPERYAIHRE
jgi:YHS domain-containing protein